MTNINSYLGCMLPYRGHEAAEQRLKSLENFFRTLEDATERLDWLEVVMCVDSDDSTRYKAMSMLNKCPCGSKFVITNLCRRTPVQKWNACADRSSAEYVLCVGGDIEFKTYGWDRMYREAIDDFPNKIGVAYSNDLHWTKGQRCNNHCVSRGFIQALGYWMLPDLNIYYSDDVMTELGKRTNMAFMHNCVLEHVHPCRKDRTVESDAIYEQTNEFYKEDRPTFDWWKENQMAEDVAKLQDLMREHQSIR